MEKEEKFEPKDSTRHRREGEQTVTQKAGHGHRLKDAKMENPSMKRKYSEQPPTKHNAKT